MAATLCRVPRGTESARLDAHQTTEEQRRSHQAAVMRSSVSVNDLHPDACDQALSVKLHIPWSEQSTLGPPRPSLKSSRQAKWQLPH